MYSSKILKRLGLTFVFNFLFPSVKSNFRNTVCLLNWNFCCVNTILSILGLKLVQCFSKNRNHIKTLGGTLPIQNGKRHHQEQLVRRATPSEPPTQASRRAASSELSAPQNRRALLDEATASPVRRAAPVDAASLKSRQSAPAHRAPPFSTLPRLRPHLQEKYSTDTIRHSDLAVDFYLKYLF